MTYELPGQKQRLVFTHRVLKHLHQQRQIKRKQSEAGGQLFAKITPQVVKVVAATGPHMRDLRKRFSFIPNKRRLRKEINEYFLKGLHYVGDWHTHPQKIPKPSWLDLISMRECYIKSSHELDHFILVILGNSIGTKRIWVGLINQTQTITLDTERKNMLNEFGNPMDLIDPNGIIQPPHF